MRLGIRETPRHIFHQQIFEKNAMTSQNNGSASKFKTGGQKSMAIPETIPFLGTDLDRQ